MIGGSSRPQGGVHFHGKGFEGCSTSALQTLRRWRGECVGWRVAHVGLCRALARACGRGGAHPIGTIAVCCVRIETGSSVAPYLATTTRALTSPRALVAPRA